MTPDPLDRLREEVHVGPDVTDAVMERLGYRAVPRRTARWQRVMHAATCLSVIGASIVGVAWAIDLGWKARLGTEASSRRASNLSGPGASGAERWEALEESLRPLRRIVEEIDSPATEPADRPIEPPAWLPARAPFGEA